MHLKEVDEVDISIIPLLTVKKIWGPERLTHLPKDTQLISGILSQCKQAIWLKSLCFNQHTVQLLSVVQ